MTIRDLINQFQIQGAFVIKTYNEDTEEVTVVAEGYELSNAAVKEEYIDAEILYMYPEDDAIVFEIKA